MDNTLVGLIKWCFRDDTSGMVTILVCWLLGSFITDCIKAFRGEN